MEHRAEGANRGWESLASRAAGRVCTYPCAGHQFGKWPEPSDNSRDRGAFHMNAASRQRDRDSELAEDSGRCGDSVVLRHDKMSRQVRVRRVLTGQFAGRKIRSVRPQPLGLREVTWWSPPVFYAHKYKHMGFATVSGADYNTYAVLCTWYEVWHETAGPSGTRTVTELAEIRRRTWRFRGCAGH